MGAHKIMLAAPSPPKIQRTLVRLEPLSCFYPFTREGGHTPSGGAWDPKWGFDSYFFNMIFSNLN